MGRDPRPTGSLHRAEQSIAPRSVAWLAVGHNSFFKPPVKRSAEYRIDHLYRRWPLWAMELTRRPGRLLLERRAFMLKSRMPQSEYIMNIFYIIGVIVVILFVAGFLGLR